MRKKGDASFVDFSDISQIIVDGGGILDKPLPSLVLSYKQADPDAKTFQTSGDDVG
jgi:hypothetical protein